MECAAHKITFWWVAGRAPRMWPLAATVDPDPPNHISQPPLPVPSAAAAAAPPAQPTASTITSPNERHPTLRHHWPLVVWSRPARAAVGKESDDSGRDRPRRQSESGKAKAKPNHARRNFPRLLQA